MERVSTRDCGVVDDLGDGLVYLQQIMVRRAYV